MFTDKRLSVNNTALPVQCQKLFADINKRLSERHLSPTLTPVPLRYTCSEAPLIGAVDIGGTKIAVGVVNGEGQILARTQCSTASIEGPTEAISRITTMLRTCEEEAGLSVEGIGIGCTGPVDPITGVLGRVDLLPGWEGLRITERLSATMHVPCVMENDADAAALAEVRWGAGKDVGVFIYVTVSTGIGGGLVIGGRLYRGARGAHPEFGHHVIDNQGPVCYCGAHGCWEALASGPALAEWVRRNAVTTDFLPDRLSAQDVCRRARTLDPLCVRAVERGAYYLGLGLSNLINMFCPDVIALGGGLMQSSELFLPGALGVIQTHCSLVPSENTRICLAALGSDTPVLGAACVWQHRSQSKERGSMC